MPRVDLRDGRTRDFPNAPDMGIFILRRKYLIAMADCDLRIFQD